MHLFSVIFIALATVVMSLLLLKGIRFKYNVIDVLFIGVSFIVLAIFHIGVDINSVEDLPGYSRDYISISGLSIGQVFEFSETSDHMYSLMNKIVSYFTDDFSYFLLVYNIILLYSHYHLFRLYSPYIPLSILLFVLLSYNQSLFVLRQYLGLSILLFTIPCILNKEFVKYAFLCVLAFFFHSSSIVWFPIYFLYNIKNRWNFAIVLSITLFVIAFVSYKLRDFMFILGPHYDAYVEQQENALGAIIVRAFFFLTYILFLKKHVMDEGINKFCFITLFIVFVGFMFAPPLRGFSRLLHYFTTLSMISIPVTMKYMKSMIIRLFFLLITISFYGQQFLLGLKEDFFSNYQFSNPSFLIYIVVFAFSIYIILKTDIGLVLFKRKKNRENSGYMRLKELYNE